MPSEKKPIGELFTHVYLDRSVQLADKELFRRRLGGYVDRECSDYRGGIAGYIKIETGLTVPVSGGNYSIEGLFAQTHIQYALNLITLIWRYLQENAKTYTTAGYVSKSAQAWLVFVRRALKEENLHYTLDDSCGVHYLVDKEFEQNRSSTLTCLESGRYAGARVAFESAFNYLEANPADTKAAVRSIFESAEIIARLMITAKNLNRKLVETELTTLATKQHLKDPTATKAVTQLLAGFGDWVDAIHNYRHGQGSIEPVAPSLDVTIYILSSGAAFVRWLVSLDANSAQ